MFNDYVYVYQRPAYGIYGGVLKNRTQRFNATEVQWLRWFGVNHLRIFPIIIYVCMNSLLVQCGFISWNWHLRSCITNFWPHFALESSDSSGRKQPQLLQLEIPGSLFISQMHRCTIPWSQCDVIPASTMMGWGGVEYEQKMRILSRIIYNYPFLRFWTMH